MKSGRKPKVGLVLTGGGARAAYQAGVLRGIAEILDQDEPPFQVLTGVSAGAVNSTFLSGSREGFLSSTRSLNDLWKSLQLNDVFRTDLGAFSRLSAGWIRDLGFGGIFGNSTSTHLLDTSPLRSYLESKIDFSNLRKNVEERVIHGVAVSATNYFSGTAISFFDGDPGISPWVRSFRLGQRSSLTLDHVLASAAIPLLFPPVSISGDYYGDGGVRMSAPLSPAIHLGADRVLAIGIRYLRPDDTILKINEATQARQITLADIAGVMMNATFLDSLDTDLERMIRINQTLSFITPEIRALHPQKLREIPVLVIRPSQDLGKMASEQFINFPRTLRYFLKGLGASKEKGWDFLSYLAFDPAYTGNLLELGYKDALSQKTEITVFFEK